MEVTGIDTDINDMRTAGCVAVVKFHVIHEMRKLHRNKFIILLGVIKIRK